MDRKAPTKELILGANDGKVEPLDVPEWPCDVYIRVMSGNHRDAFEQATIDARGKATGGIIGIRARLAAYTVCDADGKLLFADDQDEPSMADMRALGKKSGAALTRIFAASMKLNRLTEKDADELLGNSGGDQSGDSGSA